MSGTTVIPELLYSGKVRDTFPGPDDSLLVMVASDRISVYDVILNELVEGKGVVLTHLTRHWFTKTPVGLVAPNHLVSTHPHDLPEWAEPFAGRAMLVKRAEMLPVEFIVRGRLTGSALKSYQEDGTVNGVVLPEGMQEMEPFPDPMFTPSTKAPQGQKDENITIEQMVEILGDRGLAEHAMRISTEIYEEGAKYAEERGIILVDTKIELGLVDGELTVCDEVLTPDSSRYVLAETLEIGKPPKSMDKQIVRDWATGTGWDKQPPPPPVPDRVIAETKAVYGDIAERLTDINPIAA